MSSIWTCTSECRKAWLWLRLADSDGRPVAANSGQLTAMEGVEVSGGAGGVHAVDLPGKVLVPKI